MGAVRRGPDGRPLLQIARFYGADDVKVLNYGLKKEFLDRYNVNEVMEKNRLRVDLILEDIERIIKY